MEKRRKLISVITSLMFLISLNGYKPNKLFSYDVKNGLEKHEYLCEEHDFTPMLKEIKPIRKKK